MPAPEYHLRFLRACLENLEDYLLASILYWPIGVPPTQGESPYPQMTIGNLLVERALLAALESGGSGASLADIDTDLDRIRAKWRVAWETKLDAEIPSRLRQWQEWLREESAQGPPAPGHFRSGIRLRLMLDLLAGENTPAAESLSQQTRALDRKLRAFIRSGEFVWDQEYEPGFPRDVYWYLYVDL